MTNTGPQPLLDERREIDGVWHVWCGRGWIAEVYSLLRLNPESLRKAADDAYLASVRAARDAEVAADPSLTQWPLGRPIKDVE